MKRSTQLVTIGIGLIIAITIYVFGVSQQQRKNNIALTATEELFTTAHYNTMYVDTFIQLLQQTYEGSVQQEKKNNMLIVSIQNQQNLAKDFYNGNNRLLNFDLKDFGFKIENNNNSTIATFEIKDGGVNVPNDVLLKIASKMKNHGN